MPTPPALILRRADLAALMDLAAYRDAVEAAFRAHAEGKAASPMPLHIAVEDGGFHAKGAFVQLERAYVAVKVNSNFPGNPSHSGLPTIQGAVLLYDGADGRLLAILDSIEITSKRTAAASAIAARHLARPDSTSIAICGCGEQGRAQLLALAQVLPLERAIAWDVDADKAERFAHEMGNALLREVRSVRALRDATRGSDVVVTATSAKSAFLMRDCISPGTFIAAIGADAPHKSELHPDLYASAKVVVDLIEQAAVMGDLHHAIEAGRVTASHVHAELSDVVVGRKSGRTDRDEITIFDSTGVGTQDVASAAMAYQRAIAANAGTPISLDV